MSELDIKQEKYDRYIDSTVDLFMECYDDVLTEEIHKEVETLKKQEVDFPDSLDKRCRALIKRERIRSRRKQNTKVLLKGLRYVAIFAVALLSLSSLLFMTVEAFRVPIINFFIEKNEGYWIITGEEEAQNPSSGSIDLADPLAGMIPKEYELILLDGDSLDNLTAIYAKESSDEVFLTIGPSKDSIQIDAEDMEFSNECEIAGCEAVLVKEDGTLRLVWMQKDVECLFTLASNSLTDAEIVAIAEELTNRIMG